MFNFTGLLTAGMNIIDKIIPDPKEKAEAKLKLLALQQSGELEMIGHQANVIIAEAQSDSVIARNWRPLLMLLFGAIIANNYLVGPILRASGLQYVILDLPPNMWKLIEIGLGGYVVGRSMEKTVKAWKAK